MVTDPGKPVVPKMDATLAVLSGQQCLVCHKGYFDLLHEWCLSCLGTGYQMEKVLGINCFMKYQRILTKRYGR